MHRMRIIQEEISVILKRKPQGTSCTIQTARHNFLTTMGLSALGNEFMHLSTRGICKKNSEGVVVDGVKDEEMEEVKWMKGGKKKVKDVELEREACKSFYKLKI